MTGTQLVSVVIPCHNEEAHLRTLVEDLTAVVDHDRMEAVLVDDGSTDATLAVMRDLAAAYPEVRFVSLSRNFGKEAAMLAGLRAARGDLVVIMDGDGQHPPEVIPALVRCQSETGADQIVARRDRSGEPALRSAISNLYYRLANRLTEIDLVSGDGDFRLLTRLAVDAVLDLQETNRFSKGLFAWIGFRTEIVTYPNRLRESGSSSWNRTSLVNYGIDGLLSFNSRPLRTVIHIGWVAVALAFAYLLWVIVVTLVNGIEAPGYVTVIAMVVFMGGLQLISIGVVGEYVGRIFMETKRRPMYFVAETSSDSRRVADGDGSVLRSGDELGQI